MDGGAWNAEVVTQAFTLDFTHHARGSHLKHEPGPPTLLDHKETSVPAENAVIFLGRGVLPRTRSQENHRARRLALSDKLNPQLFL